MRVEIFMIFCKSFLKNKNLEAKIQKDVKEYEIIDFLMSTYLNFTFSNYL